MFSIIVVLTALSIHRIYNYEDIAEPLRRVLKWKPLSCAACNAFWIGALVIIGALVMQAFPDHPLTAVGHSLYHGFSLYFILRIGLWVMMFFSLLTQIASDVRRKLSVRRPDLTKPSQPAAAVPVPPKKEEKGCTTCGEKAEAAKTEQKRVMGYERRVVIMTALANFDPSYSLVSVILDQARMLARRGNWLIQVWVMQGANTAQWPTDMPPNVELKKVIPHVPFREDVVDDKGVTILKDALTRELILLGNATIITHDLLFISWYVTFAAAIHRIGELKGFTWFHVAHSSPRPQDHERATPDTPRWFRHHLPEGRHHLVALAAGQAPGLIAHYGFVTPERIHVWPNPRDLRSLGMDPLTNKIISQAAVHDADVVQVYPISTTRFEAKGLSKLIRAFAEVEKSYNLSVRLIIVNPHANGERGQSIIEQAKVFAKSVGLSFDALHFTSEIVPESATSGLSSRVVRELFQFSNVFVFPTMAEASSLILMEAALAGVPLVLNRQVDSLHDIVPVERAQWIDWGTTEHDGQSPDTALSAAAAIYQAATSALPAKTLILRERNLDRLGESLIADLERTMLVPA